LRRGFNDVHRDASEVRRPVAYWQVARHKWVAVEGQVVAKRKRIWDASAARVGRAAAVARWV